MITKEQAIKIEADVKTFQPQWYFCNFEKSKSFIGRRFGGWIILKPLKHKGLIYFLCQCKCGTTKRVTKASIVHGTSSSCYRCSMGFVETGLGKKFGDYTIKRSTSKVDGRLLLQCKCGTMEKKTKAFLIHPGTTKTCHHKTGIIGKRFSSLTILGRSIYRFPNSKTNGYKCRCDCGNIIVAPAYSVEVGAWKSCGCAKFSWRKKNK